MTNMVFKFSFCYVFLPIICGFYLCLCNSEAKSITSNVLNSGEYPFLVLIEVKSRSGSKEYLNGCLASFSWVLTLSTTLSQLPTGKSNNYTMTVYAGLTSLSNMDTSINRSVSRIVTSLLNTEDNTYFPNLLLLKLDTAFPEGKLIRPVQFNIGMLGTRSWLVGWVSQAGTNHTMPHALRIKMVTLTARACASWSLVEFPQQICSYALEPLSFHALESALLLDKGYLTAVYQFDTYFRSPETTSVNVMVRIGFYMSWIQFYATDPVPEKHFLRTDFPNDDLKVEPWYGKASLEIAGKTADQGESSEHQESGCTNL